MGKMGKKITGITFADKNISFPPLQPRHPQVDRPRPHRHQRQAKGPASPLLQDQEVPPSRPPTQADPCHPPQTLPGGQRKEVGEDEEAPVTLPPTEICCQGSLMPSNPLFRLSKKLALDEGQPSALFTSFYTNTGMPRPRRDDCEDRRG